MKPSKPSKRVVVKTAMGSDPLLKTQQVARALGVSPTTIKRWVDSGALRATRTVGMHRLVPLSEVYRFARQQGLSVEGLSGLAAEGAAGPAGGLSPLASGVGEASLEVLARALIEGDARRAKGVLHSAYASGCDAVVLADRLIRPAMERIGHGWAGGSLEVYQEHQASQVVASAVTELIERRARSQSHSGPTPLALGAGPEGDLYTISLLLAELALLEAGWDVRNLGPNLPTRSLAGAVLRYRPRLVFLSVNHLADPERFAREYTQFHDAASSVNAAVVLGGRAIGPDLRTRLAYASYGERLAHLSEFARRLVPSAGLPSGGGDYGQRQAVEPLPYGGHAADHGLTPGAGHGNGHGHGNGNGNGFGHGPGNGNGHG